MAPFDVLWKHRAQKAVLLESGSVVLKKIFPRPTADTAQPQTKSAPIFYIRTVPIISTGDDIYFFLSIATFTIKMMELTDTNKTMVDFNFTMVNSRGKKNWKRKKKGNVNENYQDPMTHQSRGSMIIINTKTLCRHCPSAHGGAAALLLQWHATCNEWNWLALACLPWLGLALAPGRWPMRLLVEWERPACLRHLRQLFITARVE